MTAVFMRAIEADCDCLEKGHCSRWLVTYCGHSNAPVGVRYERVSLYASSSCMLSCPNLGTLRDVLACRKFHLLTVCCERWQRSSCSSGAPWKEALRHSSRARRRQSTWNKHSRRRPARRWHRRCSTTSTTTFRTRYSWMPTLLLNSRVKAVAAECVTCPRSRNKLCINHKSYIISKSSLYCFLILQL